MCIYIHLDTLVLHIKARKAHVTTLSQLLRPLSPPSPESRPTSAGLKKLWVKMGQIKKAEKGDSPGITWHSII